MQKLNYSVLCHPIPIYICMYVLSVIILYAYVHYQHLCVCIMDKIICQYHTINKHPYANFTYNLHRLTHCVEPFFHSLYAVMQFTVQLYVVVSLLAINRKSVGHCIFSYK